MKCRYVHRWPSVSSSSSSSPFSFIASFASLNTPYSNTVCMYLIHLASIARLSLTLPSLPPALFVYSSIRLLGRSYVRPSIHLFVRLFALELCDRISRCSISLCVHSWIILTAEHPLCLYTSLQAICYLIYMNLPLKRLPPLPWLPYVYTVHWVHTCVSFYWKLLRNCSMLNRFLNWCSCCWCWWMLSLAGELQCCRSSFYRCFALLAFKVVIWIRIQMRVRMYGDCIFLSSIRAHIVKTFIELQMLAMGAFKHVRLLTNYLSHTMPSKMVSRGKKNDTILFVMRFRCPT